MTSSSFPRQSPSGLHSGMNDRRHDSQPCRRSPWRNVLLETGPWTCLVRHGNEKVLVSRREDGLNPGPGSRSRGMGPDVGRQAVQDHDDRGWPGLVVNILADQAVLGPGDPGELRFQKGRRAFKSTPGTQAFGKIDEGNGGRSLCCSRLEKCQSRTQRMPPDTPRRRHTTAIRVPASVVLRFRSAWGSDRTSTATIGTSCFWDLSFRAVPGQGTTIRGRTLLSVTIIPWCGPASQDMVGRSPHGRSESGRGCFNFRTWRDGDGLRYHDPPGSRRRPRSGRKCMPRARPEPVPGGPRRRHSGRSAASQTGADRTCS